MVLGCDYVRHLLVVKLVFHKEVLTLKSAEYRILRKQCNGVHVIDVQRFGIDFVRCQMVDCAFCVIEFLVFMLCFCESAHDNGLATTTGWFDVSEIRVNSPAVARDKIVHAGHCFYLVLLYIFVVLVPHVVDCIRLVVSSRKVTFVDFGMVHCATKLVVDQQDTKSASLRTNAVPNQLHELEHIHIA